MEFLQDLNVIQVALLLGGLCVVGVVLLVVLNLLGALVGIIQGLLNIFGMIGSVDPTGGCGCVALLFGCAAVACFAVFGYSILSTCGTERAVVFCGWIGR